jgi:hypothetical protein
MEWTEAAGERKEIGRRLEAERKETGRRLEAERTEDRRKPDAQSEFYVGQDEVRPQEDLCSEHGIR